MEVPFNGAGPELTGVGALSLDIVRSAAFAAGICCRKGLCFRFGLSRRLGLAFLAVGSGPAGLNGSNTSLFPSFSSAWASPEDTAADALP